MKNTSWEERKATKEKKGWWEGKKDKLRKRWRSMRRKKKNNNDKDLNVAKIKNIKKNE